jgi:hypothetical protein
MNLTSAVRSMLVLAAFMLSACSNPVGIYRGSTTQTSNFGGTSSTRTVTGDLITLFASSDPNSIVVEAGGLAFTATKSGDALTFAGGQTQSVMETSGMSTTTLTSGTGSLTATSLTINLTLTTSQTASGQTANGTVMVTFTGTKI